MAESHVSNQNQVVSEASVVVTETTDTTLLDGDHWP